MNRLCICGHPKSSHVWSESQRKHRYCREGDCICSTYQSEIPTMSGMILIEDITYKLVDRDFIEVKQLEKMPRELPLGMTPEESSIQREFVQGRRYINYDRDGRLTETKIGMTQKVQDILGLPYTALENLSKAFEEVQTQNSINVRDIGNLHNQLDKEKTWLEAHKHKLNNIYSMTWWQRLKFLFKGEKELREL